MHLHSDGLRLTIAEEAGLVTSGLAVDSGARCQSVRVLNSG
jgi:hypothetical protein